MPAGAPPGRSCSGSGNPAASGWSSPDGSGSCHSSTRSLPGWPWSRPDELDAVAYSFDPALCRPAEELGLSDPWDWLRQEYAARAPYFLADALPGLDPARVVFVPHHVAHAASAALAMPDDLGDCAVLVLDGRGEK